MSVKQIGVEDIFGAALEIPSADGRASFLDRVCGGDRELRRQVETLLDAHFRAGQFLESPVSAETMTVTPSPPSEAVGTVIGPYKLMEPIGEGGMGVVYVAEQHQPVRRKVALKIIKPGMDTKQVVARFEAERQALAMMDHPNIARVFDGGTTLSGRPYFVMELVRGIPITDYCDAQKLTIRERLELFVLVCRAVQHAHQKGIIHRDLKPSNILVTLHDGVPVPKVIDFGVAKATGQALTDKTVYTAFAQLIGTPLYMSPEQVELSGLDVDTRSDIYSLGVLLYELLTGTTPFDAETLRNAAFDEMRRIIREQEPQSPSVRLSSLGETLPTVSARRSVDARRLGPSLRGELDWIVMKALEKDRRRRYETANDFAADVMRYLTDQPVEACPPSAWYRLRKFTSRNRRGLATAAVLLASGLIIGGVLLAVQLQNAGRVRQLGQDLREALAGARTAIEARDLPLAGRRIDVAQGRLGADKASLSDLAAEIDGVRREIDLREADAARFNQFIKASNHCIGTSDPNTVRLTEETLGMYGVLTEKDWLSRLENSYLAADQKQQVREMAYLLLLWLADFHVRWPEHRKDPKSVARSLDLLRRSQDFHEPTRAFYFVRAECRRLQGDAAAAEKDEKLFKAATARTAWDYYLPGHTAYWRGDLHEAIRSCRAALELQPNHRDSLFWLADHLSRPEINRLPEAIAYFTGCIALHPDDYLARRNRAYCYLRLGQRDDALAACRQLVRLFPDKADAQMTHAMVLWQLGKLDEAIAVSREAVRLEPTEPVPNANLAAYLSAAGRLDEATASYLKAIAIWSKTPLANRDDQANLNNTAWVMAKHAPKVRDRAQAAVLIRSAVEMARRAVELAPNDGTSRNTLGAVQYMDGDWKAAVATLEKSMELNNGGGAYDYIFLAMAHWRLGHADDARSWYDRAVAWMEKHEPQNRELKRFRDEAAALLGAVELPTGVFAPP